MKVTSSSSESQIDLKNSTGERGSVKGIKDVAGKFEGNAQIVLESLKLNTIEQIRKNSNNRYHQKNRQHSSEMDEFDAEKSHSKAIRKKESNEHNGEMATEKTKFTAATCVPDESRQASQSQNHMHSNTMNENNLSNKSAALLHFRGESQNENANSHHNFLALQNHLSSTLHHIPQAPQCNQQHSSASSSSSHPPIQQQNNSQQQQQQLLLLPANVGSYSSGSASAASAVDKLGSQHIITNTQEGVGDQDQEHQNQQSACKNSGENSLNKTPESNNYLHNQSFHSIQTETLNELERRLTNANAKYMRSNQTLTTMTTAQNTQALYTPQMIPSLTSVGKGSGRDYGSHTTTLLLTKKISNASFLSKNPSIQGNLINRDLDQEIDLKQGVNNISQNNIDTNKSSMNLITSDRYEKAQNLSPQDINQIDTSQVQQLQNSAHQYILNSESSQNNMQNTYEIQDSPLPIKKLPNQYQIQYQTDLKTRNHSLSEQILNQRKLQVQQQGQAQKEQNGLHYKKNQSMKELKMNIGINRKESNNIQLFTVQCENTGEPNDISDATINFQKNNHPTSFSNQNHNQNRNLNHLPSNQDQLPNPSNKNNFNTSPNNNLVSGNYTNNNNNNNNNNINNNKNQQQSQNLNHLNVQFHQSLHQDNNSSNHLQQHYNSNASNTLNISRLMKDFHEFEVKTARSQINLDFNQNDESLNCSNKPALPQIANQYIRNGIINNSNGKNTMNNQAGIKNGSANRMNINLMEQMRGINSTNNALNVINHNNIVVNMQPRQPKTTFTSDNESRKQEYLNSFGNNPSLQETKHELDKNNKTGDQESHILTSLSKQNKGSNMKQQSITIEDMKKECFLVLNQIDKIDTKYSQKVAQVLQKYMKYEEFMKLLIFEAQKPIYNTEIDFKVQFQFKPDSFLKDVVVQEIKKLEANQMLAFAEKKIECSSFYRIFQSFYHIFHNLFLKLIVLYIISCITIFVIFFTNQEMPLFFFIILVTVFFLQIILSIIYNSWRYLQKRNNISRYLFFFLCISQIAIVSGQQTSDHRSMEEDECYIITTVFRVLQILICLFLSYYFYQMNKAASLFLFCFKILQSE